MSNVNSNLNDINRVTSPTFCFKTVGLKGISFFFIYTIFTAEIKTGRNEKGKILIYFLIFFFVKEKVRIMILKRSL